MTDRRSRLVFLGVASLLSLLLVYQGHHDSPPGPSVAFVCYSSSHVLVSLLGDVPRPGVQRFPRGSTIGSVINMTLPSGDLALEGVALQTPLRNGDILHIIRKNKSTVRISRMQMPVRQAILLGIPLHPDGMSRADWLEIPGIGPAMADAIVRDRQNNGVFGTVHSLTRVPGIGEKKVQKILKFFE